MRFRFLRNRGLGPASLMDLARGLPRRQTISQRRLKSFARENDRHPRPVFSQEPPQSIALVVPCFRHAAYLPETLESLASQTRLPDELIFVDDHSPDGTAEILRSFIATRSGPGVRRSTLLVNERNIGQAASLNRGIAAASSELIMILNDDDYLMHDAVETMLGCFHDHREVALVGGHHVAFAGSDLLARSPKTDARQRLAVLPLVIHRPDEVRGYRYVDQLDMTHSGLCFRKVAWETVGGYQTDKARRVTPYSDRDFQFRVASVWPVAVAPDTAFAFWRNNSSVDGSINS